MTDPTAEAAKLLPCPFCGGEAVLEKCEGIIKGDVRWSVGCVERDGRELCMGYQSLTTYARQAEAITAWNTRPQPAPPEGEPDFLKEARQIVETIREYAVAKPEGRSVLASALSGDLRWAYRLGLTAR